jgi:hypothetical protein
LELKTLIELGAKIVNKENFKGCFRKWERDKSVGAEEEEEGRKVQREGEMRKR